MSLQRSDAENTNVMATQWFHESIKKPEADELLLADGGESIAGKFLLRRKGSAENDFILSVIYKGAPTHHAVAREREGKEFAVNKTPTGKTDLEGVVEYLRSKQPKWPVPLTEGVRGGHGGSDSNEAENAEKADEAGSLAADAKKAEEDKASAADTQKAEQEDAAAAPNQIEHDVVVAASEADKAEPENTNENAGAEDQTAAAKKVEEDKTAAEVAKRAEDAQKAAEAEAAVAAKAAEAAAAATAAETKRVNEKAKADLDTNLAKLDAGKFRAIEKARSEIKAKLKASTSLNANDTAATRIKKVNDAMDTIDSTTSCRPWTIATAGGDLNPKSRDLLKEVRNVHGTCIPVVRKTGYNYGSDRLRVNKDWSSAHGGHCVYEEELEALFGTNGEGIAKLLDPSEDFSQNDIDEWVQEQLDEQVAEIERRANVILEKEKEKVEKVEMARKAASDVRAAAEEKRAAGSKKAAEAVKNAEAAAKARAVAEAEKRAAEDAGVADSMAARIAAIKNKAIAADEENDARRKATRIRSEKAKRKAAAITWQEQNLYVRNSDGKVCKVEKVSGVDLSVTCTLPNGKKGNKDSTIDAFTPATEDEWTRAVESAEIDAKIKPVLEGIRNGTLKVINLKNANLRDTQAELLANSLKGNSSVIRMDLSYNHISASGGIALAKALSHPESSVTMVYLRGNNLGDLGATAFATMLAKNAVISHIVLSSNAIGDDGATALFQALQQNTAVKLLNLHKNSVGNSSMAALRDALLFCDSLLAQINLSDNMVGDQGAETLAPAFGKVAEETKHFKGNSKLVHVNFKRNQIGNRGEAAFAISLKDNDVSVLRNLELEGNNITGSIDLVADNVQQRALVWKSKWAYAFSSEGKIAKVVDVSPTDLKVTLAFPDNSSSSTDTIDDCKPGTKEAFDVTALGLPGTRVVRSSDWCYVGDPDGAAGLAGTVVPRPVCVDMPLDTNGKPIDGFACVMWDHTSISGAVGVFMCGYADRYAFQHEDNTRNSWLKERAVVYDPEVVGAARRIADAKLETASKRSQRKAGRALARVQTFLRNDGDSSPDDSNSSPDSAKGAKPVPEKFARMMAIPAGFSSGKMAKAIAAHSLLVGAIIAITVMVVQVVLLGTKRAASANELAGISSAAASVGIMNPNASCTEPAPFCCDACSNVDGLNCNGGCLDSPSDDFMMLVTRTFPIAQRCCPESMSGMADSLNLIFTFTMVVSILALLNGLQNFYEIWKGEKTKINAEAEIKASMKKKGDDVEAALIDDGGSSNVDDAAVPTGNDALDPNLFEWRAVPTSSFAVFLRRIRILIVGEPSKIQNHRNFRSDAPVGTVANPAQHEYVSKNVSIFVYLLPAVHTVLLIFIRSMRTAAVSQGAPISCYGCEGSIKWHDGIDIIESSTKEASNLGTALAIMSTLGSLFTITSIASRNADESFASALKDAVADLGNTDSNTLPPAQPLQPLVELFGGGDTKVTFKISCHPCDQSNVPGMSTWLIYTLDGSRPSINVDFIESMGIQLGTEHVNGILAEAPSVKHIAASDAGLEAAQLKRCRAIAVRSLKIATGTKVVVSNEVVCELTGAVLSHPSATAIADEKAAEERNVAAAKAAARKAALLEMKRHPTGFPKDISVTALGIGLEYTAPSGARVLKVGVDDTVRSADPKKLGYRTFVDPKKEAPARFRVEQVEEGYVPTLKTLAPLLEETLARGAYPDLNTELGALPIEVGDVVVTTNGNRWRCGTVEQALPGTAESVDCTVRYISEIVDNTVSFVTRRSHSYGLPDGCFDDADCSTRKVCYCNATVRVEQEVVVHTLGRTLWSDTRKDETLAAYGKAWYLLWPEQSDS